jgi:nitroreductase
MSRLESLSDLPGGRAPTDDIWKAIYTQRAIRYWQDRPVPRELLQQVIEAASKAPSGSNTQPWIFVVVDDPAKLALIAAALRAFFENAEPLQDLIEKGQDSLERAPALVVPCLYQLSSPTPDPTSLLAGSSIYMAVQNLMLSARALGLGTVMTTAHALIEPDLRKALDLPSDAHPVALIPIGYPDANFGPTTRKGLEEILRWNAWT